jgi:hypothetical protein
MTRAPLRAVEFLLAAISNDVGEDGLMHQFSVDRRAHVGGMYATIFFSWRALVTAALFVREHGASYLRALPISEVTTLLTQFIKDNYTPLAKETLFKRLDGPFLLHVSEGTKDCLAEAMEHSVLFNPDLELTVFPLLTVQVSDDFSGPYFFFRKPSGLVEEIPQPLHKLLAPSRFPPLVRTEWKYRSESPSAWLGIKAHGLTSARKTLRAVLGAVSLTQSEPYRHMFSGRPMWGGYWKIAGSSFSISFGDADTPPSMENIVLTAADHKWLEILSDKIGNESRLIRRQMTALEYHYRAWPLGPSERFPILCMTLDAAYSEIAGTTAAVIDGVQATLGALDERRLRDLLEIRGSVIHGGAPDVYDSRKYGKYFRDYGEDPITDMGLLVAACLRERIFGGTLVEHAEPHQEIIEKARTQGRMPKSDFKSTILEIKRSVTEL